MGDDADLALPGSGYEQLTKILHAYALSGDKAVTPDVVAGKAGIHPTQVSRNNGFLVSVGLLTEGRAKALTPEGKTLAIALGHGLDEDAAVAWRRALTKAPASRRILEMIQVQRTVPKGALPGRIASALGLPDSNTTKTGVNCFVDILEESGLLKLTDDKYQLSEAFLETAGASAQTPRSPAEPEATQTRMPEQKTTDPSPTGGWGGETKAPHVPSAIGIPIHVNIELHLPASSEQAVYDALFKSIRDNLLS